jgi:hypothetical protein
MDISDLSEGKHTLSIFASNTANKAKFKDVTIVVERKESKPQPKPQPKRPLPVKPVPKRPTPIKKDTTPPIIKSSRVYPV